MSSPDLRQLLQPHLLPHERIVWSGQPQQGVTLSGMDALLIPFSLMWGGFAIFWNVMVWFDPFSGEGAGGADWFFKLWGLPFLFIGLYLIAGRFFHDAWLRRRQLYAVTDQRVIVLRGASTTSLDIRRLPRLDLAQHRDGRGTITFEPGNQMWMAANGLNWWLPSSGSPTRFFRIHEPRRVYELIHRQAQP